jgi:hypothetical protein
VSGIIAPRKPTIVLVRLGGVIGHFAGIERGGIDVEPGARAHHIAHDQAHDQRQGGKEQEIGKGLGRHPAHRRQIAHPGNARHDGEEDHRRDDHLDQLDEHVAHRLERFARGRIEMAEQHTGGNRGQHLDIEMGVPAPGRLGGRRRRMRGGCDHHGNAFRPLGRSRCSALLDENHRRGARAESICCAGDKTPFFRYLSSFCGHDCPKIDTAQLCNAIFGTSR